jgi:hypothetical protein
VEFEYMLNFKNVGYRFRVQSTRAENMEIVDDQEKEEHFKKMKEEMEDFTKFLKEKHFN